MKEKIKMATVSEKDISNAQERIEVTLVNEFSDERPCKFQYIPSCTGGPGIELDFTHSFYPGCTCDQGSCLVEQCECLKRFGPVYDMGCCLLPSADDEAVSQPLFECNSSCSCTASCPNRVVQRGIQIKLQVFRTMSKGWAVRTLQQIKKNKFVCEYAGEIVTYKEAKRRAQESSDTGHYIIVLREHQTGNQILRTHVDSQYCGNVARFINHSCSPNLFMTPVRVDSIIPKLAIFAARDIESGEELSFDYSGGSDVAISQGDKISDAADIVSTNVMVMQKPCLCESVYCKGYLPFDPSLYNL